MKKIICFLCCCFLFASCNEKHNAENLKREEIALLSFKAYVYREQKLINEIDNLMSTLASRNSDKAREQLSIWKECKEYYNSERVQELIYNYKNLYYLPMPNEIFGKFFMEPKDQNERYIPINSSLQHKVENQQLLYLANNQPAKIPSLIIYKLKDETIVDINGINIKVGPNEDDFKKFHLKKYYNQFKLKKPIRVEYYFDDKVYKTEYYTRDGELEGIDYTPFMIENENKKEEDKK